MIVVEPRGGYAYCLQRGTTQVSGQGTAEVGMMFFPMGRDLEMFEEYGWPAKKEG